MRRHRPQSGEQRRARSEEDPLPRVHDSSDSSSPASSARRPTAHLPALAG
ncbi:Hypothetical protein A7982_07213 [Minicystis rosea]|nr:Hypothetical protein A7982_07213 [Minicystis rosea]